MRSSVKLLMAIHCHQPVGNFGFVFEEAYAKAYEPFLSVLERHPGVHLALHYSGCLIDWLSDHRSEFLDRVKALVNKGQIEVLASGYYEPILPLLSEADRQGQIAKMRLALHELFRADAKGLWLTERVWEPELPRTLKSALIDYTMLDTNQFAMAKAWLPQSLQLQDESFWDLLGCYSTLYADSSVVLFPASKRLRYWMPFQPVDRTIDFLRRLMREEPFDATGPNCELVQPESVAITFADDGEKFGLWPKTYSWVYEEGWLDQFFSALEREASWLTTITFEEYLRRYSTNGTVYLPCGSYEEMLEWSGGYFRNFFTKYPEANAMYQKMLRVSQQIQEVQSLKDKVSKTRKQAKLSTLDTNILAKAQNELYQAQCNCAYWHGVFGGLYLGHLRRAVYAHLLEAERLASRAANQVTSLTVCDADGDGCEEVSVSTETMRILIDPADGGTISEWSIYGVGINILDTLSRRYETYHDKLRSKQAKAAYAENVPASIHDALGVKEENLASHLVYDDHRRSAFLDHSLQRMPTLHELVKSTWGERRMWSAGQFRLALTPKPSRKKDEPFTVAMVRDISGGRISKTISIAADHPYIDCLYRIDALRIPVVALEFNLSLRDQRYLANPQEYSSLSAFSVEEQDSGISLQLSLDPPARLVHFPVETVSESEDGLERTYQGLCVMCLWTPEESRNRISSSPYDISWTSNLKWTLITHSKKCQNLASQYRD